MCERKFYNKSGMKICLVHDTGLENRMTAGVGALFYSFVVAEKT